MRSSTSVSDRARGTTRRSIRAIGTLLLACALLAVGAEAMARLALDRVSKIQRRTMAEYALARTIGHDHDGRTHVLVAGNSLLLEGVDFTRVHDRLLPQWDAQRFVVEQTAYYDWLYGLRRLFAEGARPDVVVLVLTGTMWTQDDWRGDYSAQYLLRTADAFDAARDLRMNSTQTADLLFANISKFWGARAEIRNFVLGKFMPEVGDVMKFSQVIDETIPDNEETRHKIAPRLAAIRRLAWSYHARFIAVVPPIRKIADGAPGLIEAGADAGVPVLRPVVSGAYPPQLYRDAGFHLNEQGATKFTAVLIPALVGELETLRGPDMRTVSRTGGQ